MGALPILRWVAGLIELIEAVECSCHRFRVPVMAELDQRYPQAVRSKRGHWIQNFLNVATVFEYTWVLKLISARCPLKQSLSSHDG